MSTLALPTPLRFSIDLMNDRIRRMPEFLRRNREGVQRGTDYDLVVAQMYGFDDQFEFEVEMTPGFVPPNYYLPKMALARPTWLSPEGIAASLEVTHSDFTYRQTNVHCTSAIDSMTLDRNGGREWANERGWPWKPSYRLLLLRYEKELEVPDA